MSSLPQRSLRLVRRFGPGKVLQVAAAVGMPALAIAMAIAFFTGSVSWALALLGATSLLVLSAVAVMWRGVRRTLSAHAARLARIEAVQRKILASVEQERLDNAERHVALLSAATDRAEIHAKAE